MRFYAEEYSQALGRTITYLGIPVASRRDGLFQRRLLIHPVDRLAMIADPHRAGRYDRMSDDCAH
jgi:hypothetical protein